MTPHSSTLAWKIPWTEEPEKLQSMGSLRVRHDWATSLSLSCIGEGNGNALQYSCLENCRDGGAWWAAVYGVAESRTWLKQLSSSSSIGISIGLAWLWVACLLMFRVIFLFFWRISMVCLALELVSFGVKLGCRAGMEIFGWALVY